MHRQLNITLIIGLSLPLVSLLMRADVGANELAGVFPPGKEARILEAFHPFEPGGEVSLGCEFEGLAVRKQAFEARLKGPNDERVGLVVSVKARSGVDGDPPYSLTRSRPESSVCQQGLARLESRFRAQADDGFWEDVITITPTSTLARARQGRGPAGIAQPLWWLSLFATLGSVIAWVVVGRAPRAQPSGVADQTSE